MYKGIKRWVVQVLTDAFHYETLFCSHHFILKSRKTVKKCTDIANWKKNNKEKHLKPAGFLLFFVVFFFLNPTGGLKGTWKNPNQSRGETGQIKNY